MGISGEIFLEHSVKKSVLLCNLLLLVLINTEGALSMTPPRGPSNPIPSHLLIAFGVTSVCDGIMLCPLDTGRLSFQFFSGKSIYGGSVALMLAKINLWTLDKGELQLQKTVSPLSKY